MKYEALGKYWRCDLSLWHKLMSNLWVEVFSLKFFIEFFFENFVHI